LGRATCPDRRYFITTVVVQFMGNRNLGKKIIKIILITAKKKKGGKEKGEVIVCEYEEVDGSTAKNYPLGKKYHI